MGSPWVRSPRIQGNDGGIDRVKASFVEVTFVYVPRSENAWADALASLASCANGPLTVPIIIHDRDIPSYEVASATPEPENGKPWYHDIKTYLEKKEFPPDSAPEDQRTIIRLSSKYVDSLVLQLTFKERKSHAHTGEVSFVDEDGLAIILQLH